MSLPRSRRPVAPAPSALSVLSFRSVLLALALQVSVAAASGRGADAAADLDASCARQPEDAALRFVRVAAADPARAVDLLAADSLQRYRRALAQRLDDRFSPGSAPLREQVLGADWTRTRLRTATDTDLVGGWLGRAPLALATPPGLVDLRVADHRASAVFGHEVVVEYRPVVAPASAGASSPASSTSMSTALPFSPASPVRRRLRATREGACWKIAMPDDAWDRLDAVAATLRDARHERRFERAGASRVTLALAPVPAPVAAARGTRAGRAEPDPVDTTPLVRETDVAGAAAETDCEGGLDADQPALLLWLTPEATAQPSQWQQQHTDAMLALSIDGELVMTARASSPIGRGLSLCVPGRSLEQAESIARGLMGVSTAAALTPGRSAAR